MLCVGTLWWREMIRFFRQPGRVIGTLGTPFGFWLVIGSGFGTSVSPERVDYPTYLVPGTLVMVILFTSIFAMISIIEDRREGFLQSVMIAPVSPLAIVLGHVLGGATVAMVQGILFLAVVPLLGIPLHPTSLGFVLLDLFLVAFGLTALGFAFAWRSRSVQGFHSVMNLLLLPLWLFSGALFPFEGAKGWVQKVMVLNPLSYGLRALRSAFSNGMDPLAMAVTVGFGLMTLFLAVFAVRSRLIV